MPRGSIEQSRQQWTMKLLRTWFATVGPVSIPAAADLAERIFSTPPRYTPSEKERATLDDAERFSLPFRDRQLQAYRWGSGPPVLLVHGWGGRTSQLTPFVPGLVARGFSVIGYDAPAHGHSAGRRSSLFTFADAVHVFSRELGPMHAAIAHSLGAASTIVALSKGAAVERCVLVGAPARPSEYVTRFGEQLRVPPAAIDLMRRRIGERFGVQWRDVDMPLLARQLDLPALFIHDVDDRDASIDEGREVAANWRGADFHETRGLGHRRVLRDPEVVERVVSWISAPASP